MNDNEAKVMITADASGVAPGVATAKGEVESIAPLLAQLNEQFATLSQQITEAMTAGAASTSALKDELKQLEHETEKENFNLREMVVQVHEGVESFNGFKASLREIAEVWMAAFAVEHVIEWSKEIAEAAEKTEHLAQQLGMTNQQVQQMQGVAMATGISIDAITRGLGIMDKALVNSKGSTSAQANAFKSLGISIDDGKSQMEKLMTVADKFKDMEDGPKKTALAMEAFGRSGKDLIPILNLGAEGIERINKASEEYGVTNEKALEAGVALAESWNENKLAMHGLTNILTEEFAPSIKSAVDAANELIKEFIESYKEGGAAKQILEDIGTVAKILAVSLVEVGATIVSIGEMINAVAAAIAAVISPLLDGIIALVKMVAEAFMTLGKVMIDAFNLDWGAIESDFNAGMHKLAQDALEGGRAAGNDFVQGFKTSMQALTASYAALAAADKFSASLFGKSEHEGLHEGKSAKGFDPELGATHKAKEPKSRFDQWEEKLEESKLAWSQLQDQQGSAQAYSLQAESDYWAQILQRDDLSHKERLEVLKAYLAAHTQLTKEGIAKQIEVYKTELDAAKGNSAERIRIATEEAAYIGQKYGLESKEYQAAQDQIVRIKHEAAQQLRQINEEIAKSEEKMALAGVTEAENAAKFREALGVQTKGQLIEQERAFENQRFAIQQQALEKMKAFTDPLHDPVKYQQILLQIQQLEQQHQSKLTQIDQQGVLQRTQIERNAVNQSSQLWGQNIAKLITLQQGFTATVRGIYFGMVNVISNALASVIQKWLEQQLSALLFKRAAQSVDGAATVASNAAVAGSAAFASTAAIPIVGPELAPGAAAAAYAATMAFAPMASAAGGWWDIDSDQVAQVHKNEMVLPAWAASPLRDMLTRPSNDNGAPDQRPAGAGGASASDFHFHDHTGTMTPSQIMANRGAYAKAIKQAHREGHFAGFKF